MSDKYSELQHQHYELWKKFEKTDSMKRRYELREQQDIINDQMNDFYKLSEWNGEYLNGKEAEKD